MRFARKRDAQPEALSAAKDAATRLSDVVAAMGFRLSRAQSLEALSQAAGAADWNTFRAALTAGPSAAEAERAAQNKGLAAALLHLDRSDEKSCAAMIMGLMGSYGQGNDMWQQRARSLVVVAVGAFFKVQEVSPSDDPARALREGFHLHGEHGFLDNAALCLRVFPTSEVANNIRNFLNTLPGFDYEKFHAGEVQQGKTQEQYGFLSMMITKPLGSLVDALA